MLHTSSKIVSDAISGWAGWAEYGVNLTLFQPGGADYAHHITACPPRFENLTTSLYFAGKHQSLKLR